MIILLLAALALANLAPAMKTECEGARNCTVCATRIGCAWCTTTNSTAKPPVASGVCITKLQCAVNKTVAGINMSVGVCPALHDLPCHLATVGDGCAAPLVPELNSIGNATVVDRVLHGAFLLPSGLRSALPELMCVADAQMASIGECLCRTHDKLAAASVAACAAAPVIEELRQINASNSDRICAAVASHRACVVRSIGAKCFAERYDRICALPNSGALLRRYGCTACETSIHSGAKTLALLSKGDLTCAIASSPTVCARPIYVNFAAHKRPCAGAKGGALRLPPPPALDESLARWLHLRIAPNSVVFQSGDEHQCLATFLASCGRYHWIIRQTDGRAAPPPGWIEFTAKGGARAQFIPDSQLDALPPTLDWIFVFDFPRLLQPRNASTAADVERALDRLPLGRCRFALAVAWLDSSIRNQTSALSSSTEALLIDALHRRGFLYDFDWTKRARNAASVAPLKQSLTVFLRRNLVTRTTFPDFLHSNNTGVQWNQQIPFGQKWLRAFVPPGIPWLGSKLVISIHSDPKFVSWRSSVRETWLSRARRLGFLAIFMVCNANTAVVAEALQYNDIIAIEAPYMYHAERSVLPLLEHVWFQLAARHAVDARWVMKTDHDTIVFPDALHDFIGAQAFDPLRQYVYIGSLFEVNPVRDSRHRSYVSTNLYPALQFPGFMSGGAGYIESMALVRCLTAYTATDAFNYFPRSDVGMRLAINEAGCQPLIVVGSGLFHPNSLATVPNNTITMHYVKSADKLREYWAPQLARIKHD